MTGKGKGTALLVIDVQRGFFDPEPRPLDADGVVSRVNLLAAAARAAGAVVVFFHHTRDDEGTGHGSPAWGLVDALQALPSDVYLDKATPDSFLGTGLSEVLAARGIGNVVICGYATEYCIDTTARRAGAMGFAVTVVSDAHTTNDTPHASAELIRRHHNATLQNIVFLGPRIRVRDTRQVLSDLSGAP